MDKTILDFTEATEFAADDWIILDSESGGGCRIKATQIAPVVTGIEVTYTQTQTVTVDTPLNDLRQDLIVKAIYRGGRKKEVEDYTLSGTLSVGTSNITVSYHGYDEIIEVTVSSNYIYEWDLTDSLTDKIQGATFTTQGATFTRGTGVSFPNVYSLIELSNLPVNISFGKTIEIDVGSTSLSPSSGTYTYFMSVSNLPAAFYWDRYSQRWKIRVSGEVSYIKSSNNINVFSGKTLKMILNSETDLKIYAGDEIAYEGYNIINSSYPNFDFLRFGNWGYALSGLLLTGIRIYNT